MRIVKLILENFKSVERKEYTFKDINFITGDNYTGKTTIAEGIVYGLYGISLENSNRTDSLIQLGKKKTAVEVHLQLNNDEFCIRREATTRVKDLFLNGVPISQKRMEQGLRLIDPLYFLYSFIPTFSLDKLKNKEGREFFMSFIHNIEPGDVLADMDKVFVKFIQKYDTDNPHYKITQLREENKQIDEDLIYSEGLLDSYKATLNMPLQSPEQLDKDNIQARIEEIEEILFSGKIDTPNLLNTMDIERKIMQLEMQLKQAPTEVLDLTDCSELERERIGLQQDYKALVKRLNSLSVPFHVGDECPTCTQQIAEETYNEFLEQIKEQREDIQLDIDAVTETGKLLKKRIESIQDKNNKIQQEYDKKVEEFQLSVQHEINTLKEQLDTMNQENKLLMEEYENKKNNIQNETMSLREERDRLRATLNDYEKEMIQYDEKVKQIEKAKESIAKLLQNRKLQEKNKEENNNRIKALLHYMEILSEKMSKQIQQHFNRISVKLFTITKNTGEIKPIFELLYDNKPISVLSYSEKIRAGLEIANFIKTVTGVSLPTFIDNAESITHFEDIPGQLFTASVVEGINEVTLEAFEKRNDEKQEHQEQLSLDIA